MRKPKVNNIGSKYVEADAKFYVNLILRANK